MSASSQPPRPQVILISVGVSEAGFERLEHIAVGLDKQQLQAYFDEWLLVPANQQRFTGRVRTASVPFVDNHL